MNIERHESKNIYVSGVQLAARGLNAVQNTYQCDPRSEQLLHYRQKKLLIIQIYLKLKVIYAY